MKKLLILLFVVIASATYAQETAKVYFIRPYNYSGSLIKFRCFIDETLLCALKNARYSGHDVPAGEHTFYLQPYKDDLQKNKASKLDLKLEAGKTYYLSIIWTPAIEFVEIKDETGSKITEKMRSQSDCKD